MSLSFIFWFNFLRGKKINNSFRAMSLLAVEKEDDLMYS
jgi:hypothetical protein